MSSERRLAMAVLPGMLTLAWGLAALGRGEQAGPQRAQATPLPSPSPYIFGARDCAGCHDQGRHSTYTKDERDGMICRMDEFAVFNARDPHKLAHAALTGARGRQMTKLLGTEVAQLDACLNCHSVADRGIISQHYTRETDGVTCVACHGADSRWVEKHPETGNDKWCLLDRKVKERDYGMTNLWDPVRRTEVCASCHIGNHAQGKVITHAMYAAGHPPLSSFEAAAFGDSQPPHWESGREKLSAPGRAKRLNPRPDPKNLEQTQLVVAGGLVVFRESMRLFAAQASARNPEPSPDFAQFDCQACHHDLQSAAIEPWRQTRRHASAQGRPGSPEWPLALVSLAIDVAGPQKAQARAKELNEYLDKFRQSLAIQPFGDPETSAPRRRQSLAGLSR